MINVIDTSFAIEGVTPAPWLPITFAAATSHRSHPDDPLEFCKRLLGWGHMSCFEFADMTVRFVCSRGMTHQLVRHRLFSFLQESTRYCEYDDGITVIRPQDMPDVVLGKWFFEGREVKHDSSVVLDREQALWIDTLMIMSEAYHISRRPAEMKRGMLPIDVKTEIVVKGNFRQWMHCFDERCKEAAHPEIRNLMTGVRETCGWWRELHG